MSGETQAERYVFDGPDQEQPQEQERQESDDRRDVNAQPPAKRYPAADRRQYRLGHGMKELYDRIERVGIDPAQEHPDQKQPIGDLQANIEYTGNGKKKISDRKSTRLNSSHSDRSRMPSSA